MARDILTLKDEQDLARIPKRHPEGLSCAVQLAVLDAGSGIREMSLGWLKEFGNSPIHATMLFTHYHWDHLQGFPFFTAAYMANNTLDIFGSPPDGASLEDILSGQMQGAYFPVPLSAMQAAMNFHPVEREFSIGAIRVGPTTCGAG